MSHDCEHATGHAPGACPLCLVRGAADDAAPAADSTGAEAGGLHPEVEIAASARAQADAQVSAAVERVMRAAHDLAEQDPRPPQQRARAWQQLLDRFEEHRLEEARRADVHRRKEEIAAALDVLDEHLEGLHTRRRPWRRTVRRALERSREERRALDQEHRRLTSLDVDVPPLPPRIHLPDGDGQVVLDRDLVMALREALADFWSAVAQQVAVAACQRLEAEVGSGDLCGWWRDGRLSVEPPDWRQPPGTPTAFTQGNGELARFLTTETDRLWSTPRDLPVVAAGPRQQTVRDPRHAPIEQLEPCRYCGDPARFALTTPATRARSHDRLPRPRCAAGCPATRTT